MQRDGRGGGRGEGMEGLVDTRTEGGEVVEECGEGWKTGGRFGGDEGEKEAVLKKESGSLWRRERVVRWTHE